MSWIGGLFVALVSFIVGAVLGAFFIARYVGRTIAGCMCETISQGFAEGLQALHRGHVQQAFRAATTEKPN